MVRRARLEERLLGVIQQELFTPEAIAYLTERVNEALRRLRQGKLKDAAHRRALELELFEALKERKHIQDAIRQGLIGDITREVLEEVEGRIERLRAQLNVPSGGLVAATVLPQPIETRLRELGQVLGQDTDRARELLRDLLGKVTIRPTNEGLVAELRGNVEGLLSLEKTLVTDNHGSGGLRCPRLYVLGAALGRPDTLWRSEPRQFPIASWKRRIASTCSSGLVDLALGVNHEGIVSTLRCVAPKACHSSARTRHSSGPPWSIEILASMPTDVGSRPTSVR